MAKIVFMGAGSSVFVKNVVGDCMLSPVLKDSEFALYDIDPVRLDDSRRMLTALNSNMGGHAVITAYLGVENRKDALRGASYVINAIQVGLYEPCTVTDFEVPKKYGLRQTIGDTLGIGGIFRALRTIPVMQDFADDMAAVCPDALVPQLHQSHGHADRLYAALHSHQDRGPVPQRAGAAPSGCWLALAWRYDADHPHADRGHQSSGLAAGYPR